MRNYRPKRKKNYKKIFLGVCKHIYYRLDHYFHKWIRLPGRAIDYTFGSGCYKKSPMFCALSYRDFSMERGRYGEFQLWRRLRHKLGKDCIWFSNLYLPKEDGTTCEIDLVAVSRRGIFVFESKNYNGRIYGDEKNPYWYQVIRHDLRKMPKKFSFFNPIMQNKMHCRILSSILSDYKEFIYSYVVFGNQCRLLNVIAKSQDSILCKQNQTAGYIRKHKNTVLTAEQVLKIGSCLRKYKDVSYLEKRNHIQSIEDKKK